MNAASIGIIVAALFAAAAANQRMFLALVFFLAGIPIAMLNGNASFFGALGGLNGQAVYAFALVIACAMVLVVRIGQFPSIVVQTPLLFAFLIFCLASLAWSGSMLDALRMFAKVASPILFFWAALAIGADERGRRRLENALYAGCLTCCVLAVVHLATGGLLGPRLEKIGPFGFAMLAAPYMSGANFSFLILAGLVTAYARWLSNRRFLHLALVAIFCAALILSFVRIALIAGVIAISLIHLVRARPVHVIALLVLIPGAAVLLLTSDAFMKRTFYQPQRVEWSEAYTDFDRFSANVNTSGRRQLWTLAANEFEDRSAAYGAGIGAVDAWIRTGGSGGSELHSEVYRLYLETGWIGLGLYIAGIVALWRRLRRQARLCNSHDGEIPVLCNAAIGLLPAYALTLVTDNTFNYATEFGVLVFGVCACGLQATRIAIADATASQEAHAS